MFLCLIILRGFLWRASALGKRILENKRKMEVRRQAFLQAKQEAVAREMVMEEEAKEKQSLGGLVWKKKKPDTAGDSVSGGVASGVADGGAGRGGLLADVALDDLCSDGDEEEGA